MIVIENNGKTTRVTGWRSWVLALCAVLGVAVTMTVLAFLLVGVALTIGAVLLIVVPIAVAVALIGALLGRRP
jgi:hypothetical protein